LRVWIEHSSEESLMESEGQSRSYPGGLEGRFYPRGLRDEFPDGPPTATIRHRGFILILRFAEGDFRGDGLLQKIELLPEQDGLKPRELRQFAPDAELYLAYARAGMRQFGPEGTVESRTQDVREAAEILRKIAGPGRGHSDEFFRDIVKEYNALIEGGELHPVKALSEKHHVTISAASHWLREARVRKLLPPKVKKGGKRAR
jgi:hypothetical protein